MHDQLQVCNNNLDMSSRKAYFHVCGRTVLDLLSILFEHCRTVCILASWNVSDLCKHPGQKVEACRRSRPLTPDQQVCFDPLLCAGGSHSCCVGTLQAATCQLQTIRVNWQQPWIQENLGCHSGLLQAI